VDMTELHARCVLTHTTVHSIPATWERENRSASVGREDGASTRSGRERDDAPAAVISSSAAQARIIFIIPGRWVGTQLVRNEL
jgi:hypothetical protein